MLMYTTLDPRELDREHFSNAAYKYHVQSFFHGIEENTVILGDPEGILGSELLEAVIGLPASCPEAKSIWAERQKDKKKWPIRCRRKDFGSLEQRDARWILKRLQSCCGLDAVFSSDDEILGACPLGDYLDTAFERKRKALAKPSAPLDSLTRAEVDDFLIRATRFSNWLNFYDKQIGRSRSRESLTGFKKGIDHVLSLWSKHGHFSKDSTAAVTIYTVEQKRLRDSDTEHARRGKIEDNVAAKNRIEKYLVSPLRAKYPWRIELKIKSDIDYQAHGRHLEAQTSILRSDLGFDLLDEHDKYKCNQLSLDRNFAKLIGQYKNFPDMRER